ncbi:MAG: zinc-dependent metalloprotease, partial [Candidatus Acidiferrales bacterium]
MKRALFFASLFFIAATSAAAQNGAAQMEAKPLPGIEQKITGMQRLPGFFTYYWDAREGKIWLQIDKWNTEFLYVESLPNGVGSNDIGLDRGQPGETQVVHFERSGPRVLLVAENERYRAVTDDAAQRQAAQEAFAQSVLWGFDAAA